MKELSVFFNDYDWVIAYSKEDATRLLEECDLDEHDTKLYPWFEVPCGENFVMIITEDSELPDPLPEGAEIKASDQYDYLVSAPCSAWIKAMGRCILASADEF
jgi:hypothetical protein